MYGSMPTWLQILRTEQVTELQNTRLLKALKRQPVDRTPIWIMRQAGRYLPEYRKIRAEAGDFLNLVKNPELACTVTMQPLERFPLDAVILFSDILTIPDALDLGLSFQAGEGPVFSKPLRHEADISALPTIDVAEELDYVAQAVRTIKRELAGRCPLLGFSGSPWTLATYMVEGSSSKTFSTIKGMMYQRPDLLSQLLGKLVDLVVDYLALQIDAGSDAVMLFDTWGGVLTPAAYQEFSLMPMQQIIAKLRQRYGDELPVIMFTKNGGQWLEQMATSGADCLGLDWTTDIGGAFDRVGGRVALQGNLDPCVLYGSDESIKQEVGSILEKVAGRPGHIFNLGHGIHPDVDPEKVALLVETVQA